MFFQAFPGSSRGLGPKMVKNCLFFDLPGPSRGLGPKMVQNGPFLVFRGLPAAWARKWSKMVLFWSSASWLCRGGPLPPLELPLLTLRHLPAASPAWSQSASPARETRSEIQMHRLQEQTDQLTSALVDPPLKPGEPIPRSKTDTRNPKEPRWEFREVLNPKRM